MLIKNSQTVLTFPKALEDTRRLAAVKALLVDIDNTIIWPKQSASDGPNPFNTGSLLEVLQLAGVNMGGLTSAEAERRIRKVQADIRWWHWSDFILELGLDPREFWEFAYETEKRYLEATGSEIGATAAASRCGPAPLCHQ